MKVFLDANVLVSVLNKEYPLYPFTARLLSLSDNPRVRFYTTPLCLAIAFYFAEKKSGNKVAKSKIGLLANHINVTDASKADVLNAIENKQVKDFEDGLKYYSALRAKCQCIITEDVKDFYFSKIEVLNSRNFLEKYVMK